MEKIPLSEKAVDSVPVKVPAQAKERQIASGKEYGKGAKVQEKVPEPMESGLEVKIPEVQKRLW